MFEKKKCPHCSRKIKNGWDYCPFCREDLTEKEKPETMFDPFGLSKNIEKGFERIDKQFNRDFSSMPKPKPKGMGISITIHGGSNGKPMIEVRTSGNNRKMEPGIRSNLPGYGIEDAKTQVPERVLTRIPKTTEEPETRIENMGKRERIHIKLPDVKDEKDIEIRRLEQSVEVKAFSGDKAYFKLIPIPSNSSITEKEFKKGILKIEVER